MRCVTALSGGSDSTGLLVLLSGLREEMDLTLWAVHIHHGLRKNADIDEAFCRDLCRKLAVPLSVYREDVRTAARLDGKSIEEAGRDIRYARLFETAREQKMNAVLTAHQREDQAETVLLHLLRGSGLSGLSGMSPVRKTEDGPALIRPLLSAGKEEIRQFLEEEGFAWREDESNADPSVLRNRVRLQLLPLCEGMASGAAERLASTAHSVRKSSEYLEKEALFRCAERGIVPEEDRWPLGALLSTESGLRHFVWRRILRAHGGLKDVGAVHYEALDGLLKQPSGSRTQLPGGRVFLREQETLSIIVSEEVRDEAPEYSIRTFPYEKNMKIPELQYTKWIDYAIIKSNILFRKRRDGDYFYLPGGGKKSLARFMIDEKIPLGERDRIWLLADGAHILWIVGYRISAAARVGEHTRTVAEITVKRQGEKV